MLYDLLPCPSGHLAWLLAPPRDFAFVLLSTIGVYLGIVALTRITGLRSFSKMSAPDFAMTVAVGSIFGSAISGGTPSLSIALFALACLFSGQWLFSLARRRFDQAVDWIDNQPVLLMDGPQYLEHNLSRTNVTRSDIRAKLRLAGVVHIDQVAAVVFETTGDISVLRKDGGVDRVDDEILHDVRR